MGDRRNNCVKKALRRLAAVLIGFSVPLASYATQGQGPRVNPNTSGWQEDFSSASLNKRFWVIANGRAPGYIPCDHIGYYDPSHAMLAGGYLVLTLTQAVGAVDGCTGFISHGALIYTRKTYGYGTYQWTMRMSSTATSPTGSGVPESGSVSAGFIYVNNSETEIDFEFPGVSGDTLYMVNWLNPNPSSDPTSNDETATTVDGLKVADVFHAYKFVWQPGSITYYVDGVPESTHTTNVPTAPAHFMINHWGTDNPNWGGTATANVTRYFYIDSVSYTPLQ